MYSFITLRIMREIYICFLLFSLLGAYIEDVVSPDESFSVSPLEFSIYVFLCRLQYDIHISVKAPEDPPIVTSIV